jgi:hypothetical protein
VGLLEEVRGCRFAYESRLVAIVAEKAFEALARALRVVAPTSVRTINVALISPLSDTSTARRGNVEAICFVSGDKRIEI